jgi:type III secretory pathway component EscR
VFTDSDKDEDEEQESESENETESEDETQDDSQTQSDEETTVGLKSLLEDLSDENKVSFFYLLFKKKSQILYRYHIDI